MAKQQVTISLDKEMVKQIDGERGLVSRSAWIEKLLRTAMGEE